MARDLSLSTRNENIRPQQEIRHVVHFNLQEIIDRYNESIHDIEKKFELYEYLLSLNKIEEAKDILRAQIVFIVNV